MKLMAKLKELLAERKKLARYDELTEWKRKFEGMVNIPVMSIPPHVLIGLPMPDHIKEIIVNALDAEIKKLEEE